MNIKPGVDLGKAFEELKNDLRKAEGKINPADPTSHAYAYGYLKGCLQVFLFQNTTVSSIREIMTDPKDDVPTELFQSPTKS